MKTTRRITLGLVSAGAATALVLGGAAAALADDGGRGHSGSRGPLAALVADGTLTTTQLRAIHDALEAARDTDREDHHARMEADLAAVLADLVAKGTLTKAKADAIADADRGGLRALVAAGTVTRADLKAVHDALEPVREASHAEHEAERDAARSTVLAGLVTKGTLTQAEADAVATALESAPARGMGHGGRGDRGGRGGHGGDGGPRR